MFHNNPFDEAEDLDAAGEQCFNDRGEKQQPGAARGGLQQAAARAQFARAPASRAPVAEAVRSMGMGMMAQQSSSSDDDDEDEEEDDEDPPQKQAPTEVEGAYNPTITPTQRVGGRARPVPVHRGDTLARGRARVDDSKCFVPDYIPAVGEMDAFLKVPRPDGQKDNLGLQVLDEPAAAVRRDRARIAAAGRLQKQHGDVAVRSIENAAKNPQEIDRWIKSIEDLHRSKPPPQVHYRKAMPDIDKLMEEWEPEFEELLKTTPLPDENLEVTLAEFAKIACGLLDVPVRHPIVSPQRPLLRLSGVHGETCTSSAGAGGRAVMTRSNRADARPTDARRRRCRRTAGRHNSEILKCQTLTSSSKTRLAFWRMPVGSGMAAPRKSLRRYVRSRLIPRDPVRQGGQL